jgi:hypothetical protein
MESRTNSLNIVSFSQSIKRTWTISMTFLFWTGPSLLGNLTCTVAPSLNRLLRTQEFEKGRGAGGHIDFFKFRHIPKWKNVRVACFSEHYTKPKSSGWFQQPQSRSFIFHHPHSWYHSVYLKRYFCHVKLEVGIVISFVRKSLSNKKGHF